MSILDALMILNRNRPLIGLAMLAMLVLAILYLHVATYRYTVDLVVAPVESQQGQTGNLGGLGSLAAAAGISLGQAQGGVAFLKYVENIKSRGLADAVAAKHPEIMHALYSADWDAQSGQWRKPTSMVRVVTGPIKSLLGFPANEWHPPDGGDLLAYLTDGVQITRGLQTPFVTMEILVKDPKFGAKFLLTLHKEIDDVLRRAALARSNAQIAYLTKTLETITVAEHRQAIGQTLLDQEKNRMLASSSLPFAAETLGPPAPSPGPVSPRPVLVLGLFLALGAIMGSAAVLGWHWLRNGEDLYAWLIRRLRRRHR